MDSEQKPLLTPDQQPASDELQVSPAVTTSTEHLPTATPARSSNPLFFGRFGLRAGYGIAILLACYALLATISFSLALASSGKLPEIRRERAYHQTHPGAPHHAVHLDFTSGLVDAQDAPQFLGLLGVCWLFSRAERRPLRAYGLGSYRAVDILPGACWGVVMLSAVAGVLTALHLLVFDSQALHGAAIVVSGVKWLLAFLLVGLTEEYAFRGYLQYTLMRGVWGWAEKISTANTRAVAFWLAAGILSLLFAVAHLGNGGENLLGLVQVFLAGITFAYGLWRTGSLWWSVGFHMTWDWAQSFLFGVADSGNVSVGRLFVTHPQGRPLLSGGADGPEGSIFATIALLLTIVVIHFTTRPGVQPALEQGPQRFPDTPASLLHNPVA